VNVDLHNNDNAPKIERRRVVPMLPGIDISPRDILGGFDVPPIQAFNRFDTRHFAARDDQRGGDVANRITGGAAPSISQIQKGDEGKGHDDSRTASAPQQQGPTPGLEAGVTGVGEHQDGAKPKKDELKDKVNAPKSSGDAQVDKIKTSVVMQASGEQLKTQLDASVEQPTAAAQLSASVETPPTVAQSTLQSAMKVGTPAEMKPTMTAKAMAQMPPEAKSSASAAESVKVSSQARAISATVQGVNATVSFDLIAVLFPMLTRSAGVHRREH
jgi:hypothetical protein